jgi:hypothetical protein
MSSDRIQPELRWRPLTAPVRARTLQTSGSGADTAETVSPPQESSPNAAEQKSTSLRGPVSLCRLAGNGLWLGCNGFSGPTHCACAVADWNGRVLLRSRTGPCSSLHSNPGAAGAARISCTVSHPGSRRRFSSGRKTGARRIHTSQSPAHSHVECREQGPVDAHAEEIA